MDDHMPPLETIERIERAEVNTMLALTRAAPGDNLEEIGVNVHRLGTARAFLMEQIDWILFNRVLGLGIGEPATEAMVDAVADLYRHTWMLFAVQLSPAARPAALPRWLEARGIKRESHEPWVKFYRGVEPPPDAPTSLRVVRVENDEQGLTWAGTATVACYIHRALVYWLYRTVGRPGWHHYLAYDGDDPVACGALYVEDEVGWLGFGGTFKSRRGQGGQSALIARRIRDAADLGCRWLTTETLEDRPRWPNPSYRNMLRAGFQIAYLRHDYRLKKEVTRDEWL